MLATNVAVERSPANCDWFTLLAAHGKTVAEDEVPMARYRKRPSYCQDVSGCPGGECGKCCYNPQSGYPMFHIVRCTKEESRRQQWLCVCGMVFSAWIVFRILLGH